MLKVCTYAYRQRRLNVKKAFVLGPNIFIDFVHLMCICI